MGREYVNLRKQIGIYMLDTFADRVWNSLILSTLHSDSIFLFIFSRVA